MIYPRHCLLNLLCSHAIYAPSSSYFTYSYCCLCGILIFVMIFTNHLHVALIYMILLFHLPLMYMFISSLSCQNLVTSIFAENDFLIAHKIVNSCAHCVKISYS